MHKTKIIAGTALIGAAAVPFSLAIISIASSGGLPTDPQEYNAGSRLNLALSLSFFVYPISFLALGIGSWLVFFGVTERSIFSGEKERNKSLFGSHSFSLVRLSQSMGRQKRLMSGLSALAAAGTLLSLSLTVYYLPAIFWSEQILSCTDCPGAWTDSWISIKESLFATGSSLSILGGLLAALGIALIAHNFHGKTTPRVLGK